MRLPDDDELYQVDQTYLGPRGRYVGKFRHKALLAWFCFGPLSFVTAKKIGLPLNLLTVGLLFLATARAASWVADHATQERPLRSVLGTFWTELSARRAPRKSYGGHSSIPRVRAMPDRFAKWSQRHTTDDTTTDWMGDLDDAQNPPLHRRNHAWGQRATATSHQPVDNTEAALDE